MERIAQHRFHPKILDKAVLEKQQNKLTVDLKLDLENRSGSL
jgi:hypothetical protein